MERKLARALPRGTENKRKPGDWSYLGLGAKKTWEIDMKVLQKKDVDRQ